VSFSPTSLSFGNQNVGTTSAQQTVVLSNIGTATLTITTISTSGDFAQSNNCGTSLPAGTSCAISVTFTPTASGSRSGTLSITDNAAGSPQTVSLSGTGIAPLATLSLDSLNFGNQNAGTTSPPRSITLTNSGTAAMTITSISTSGDFAQTNNCGASLAVGASCTINVTFTPTTTQSRIGTLSVTDNASGSPQTVSLSGSGTTPTQMMQTWVSSSGSDANLCSRTAPCATFARALAQTLPGGEIDVVNPGSYGPVTIGQSVTIDGGANQAGYLLASSGNGIVVQAVGPNDIVTLRNLQIDGAGSGANGIRFLSGKNLSIENCYIFGFTQNSIDIELNSASTVQITDTVIKNSGNDGIFANSTSGLVKVDVFNSQIMVSSNNGIEASSNAYVAVHRSLLAASAGSGAVANNGGAGCGNLSIDTSDIIAGNNGLTVMNGCFSSIGHSHLGYNFGTGYNQVSGGTIVVWATGVANASNGTNIIHDTIVGMATYIAEQ
jgi:Abnormal spindle-like microcephaly-assoc'd, ASPM-SPD-2-Hydin